MALSAPGVHDLHICCRAYLMIIGVECFYALTHFS